MSDFQILITTRDKYQTECAEEVLRRGSDSASNHQRGNVINTIDELSEIWDEVIRKLSTLASISSSKLPESAYELEAIEFNIGLEAGLNIGLVTKGNAAVSVSFCKNK